MRGRPDTRALPGRCLPRLRNLALGVTLALSLSSGEHAHATGRPDFERAWTSGLLDSLHLRPEGEQRSVAAHYGLSRFLPDPARGNLIVTNCANSGAGSLRDVIASAASGDVVDLRGLTCSSITLGSGEIVVPQANLTIVGNGPETLTISSKYTNRIFNHTGNGDLNIQGVTIANGTVVGTADAIYAFGGCLRSSGRVVLGNALFVGLPELGARVENCRAIGFDGPDNLARGGGISAAAVVMVNSVVSGCEASGGSEAVGGGGGIATRSLTMLFSELSDNSVDEFSKYGGGGAAILNPQSTFDAGTIMNSTITGNRARFGGGLTLTAPMTVRNSTISGNQAIEGGAGLAVGGFTSAPDVVIANSTVTGNILEGDAFGGGLFVDSGASANLQSTLIHGNVRFGSVAEDVGGTGDLTGNDNLIGVATMAVPPDTMLGVNPLLGPLASNGGRTRTHALLPGSPAISLGNNAAALATDQRGPGFPRVIGAFADIGAYEFDPDRLFSDGFE
jgi:hypothetical protein